jgi:outer membrane protein assembly factor BamA
VIALLVAMLTIGGTESPDLHAASETIVAVQIHGNTLTPDDEIRRLAAIDVGAAVDEHTIDAVAERLRATHRFESVQVLKRFASIADPSQVLLVIIVDEGPVKIERTGNPDQPTRVSKAGGTRIMFLPVLTAEDGYGLTYGARFAWPQPIGQNSRVAFPLTWGGEKRAAAEIEKLFTGAAIDRVSAGASLSRRTNPFFDRDDDRTRVWIRGERQLARAVRAGGTLGWQRAAFDNSVDHFGHAGVDVVLDTRVDPIVPRNAVFARAAWERIGGANRFDVDARGYVGLVGQAVLAARALRSDADRPLAPYLKPLAGGMANLRGFAAGTAAGDSILATSAELIVPLTSPLSFGRVGVNAFVDAATAYDKGQRLRDQEWKQGIGGGVWFSAAFVRLNVAIAHGRGSSTRVHVGANVSF